MPSTLRPAKLHLAVVVLIALLLRLAIVATSAAGHPAAWFFGQSSELAVLAESVRSGHGLSSPFGGGTGPSAFLTPGYPAVVAAIFAVCGPYSTAAMVSLMSLQAVFGAATVLVLMLLTRRLFGLPVANLAGIVWAVAPPLLFLPTLFWETCLSILLAVALVAFAVGVADRPRLWRWLCFGALSALASMVNPALLPIALSSFGWATWRSRAYPGVVAALSVWVLLCAPWAVRNELQFHTFIPLRSNMGYELWQGNRPGSDGFFEPSLHPNTSPEQAARLWKLGEVGYMREKMVTARSYITENPGTFLRLSLKRTYYFWTGIVRQPAGLIVAYIVLTTLGGFVGLYLLWRRNRGLALLFALPLILFPLPYYITHPDFRFRLVVDPLLTALAAYAVLQPTTGDASDTPAEA